MMSQVWGSVLRQEWLGQSEIRMSASVEDKCHCGMRVWVGDSDGEA